MTGGIPVVLDPDGKTALDSQGRVLHLVLFRSPGRAERVWLRPEEE